MTPAPDLPLRREGRAEFSTMGAFYRAKSQIARDLAVLAASHYRQCQGRLRVLDAMTGCGVRPLRYVLEAAADWVWANEANPDLAAILAHNLGALPPGSYRITHQDANEIFLTCRQTRDLYDLVDIDNFGSPSAYVSHGLGATRMGGLLYLTSTDGRSTGGHDPEGSLKGFAAYARCHPAVHEQGLRLLIGHAVQTAAAQGMGVEPVFSVFTGQVHRAMVRLVRRSTLNSQTYGFIAYCHGCGHFQTVGWRQLGRVTCGGCGPGADPAPVVSGPLWLGPLHRAETVEALASLALQWGWQHPARLLRVMAQEATLPPYYYPLGDMGRLGKMDIPNRDRLIAALREQGYRATVTHLDWQAVKTDAEFGDCVAIAKTCHD
jgi:tRNA (guanine26-N2/guanine27-N2)-dimethyltransferase